MTKYNDRLNELQEALNNAVSLLERATDENASEFSKNYTYKDCKRLQAEFNKALGEYIDFLKDCN